MRTLALLCLWATPALAAPPAPPPSAAPASAPAVEATPPVIPAPAEAPGPEPGTRRCPAGQLVAGIKADGALICEAPSPLSPTPLPPVARSAPSDRAPVEPFARDGDGRVLVPIARWRALLADPTPLMRSARVVPKYQEGAWVGFRVMGVRRQSLVAALGFKSGDVIQTVAGQPLHSPDEALALYSTLRAAAPGQTIEVAFTRRGRPQTLVYRLQ